MFLLSQKGISAEESGTHRPARDSPSSEGHELRGHAPAQPAVGTSAPRDGRGWSLTAEVRPEASRTQSATRRERERGEMLDRI